MHVLFLHQNFPGQFKSLAPALAHAGHQVHALALHERAVPAGVHRHLYRIATKPAADLHPLVREWESKVLRGEGSLLAMRRLKEAGLDPELVITNPAWGEALFVKDLWPKARVLCLMEWYYRPIEMAFDAEFAKGDELSTALRLRMKNVVLHEAMRAMDRGVAPTAWQRAQLPDDGQARCEVIFDGIATDAIRPDAAAELALPDGSIVRAGDEIVTFVARNLEPYRGYHVFMRSLPALLANRPGARVLIVGGDGVSYGAAAPAGTTWKQRFLDEVGDSIDRSRVHFLGRVPYGTFVKVLQVSAAHVYLTYPFVLSWSCLEAMSAGCHVIGSRTGPVQEYIEDGVNGTLVDFFDTAGLAQTIAGVLESRRSDAALRERARRTAIERCDLTRVCLPQYAQLLASMLGRPVM